MSWIAIAIAICSGPSAARENNAGISAWKNHDTASALRHLEAASKDTSDATYAYNLGTVRALSRKTGADTAFDAALSTAKSPQERARILYNRGTDRLNQAAAGNCQATNGAIQDLRESLKLKPNWQEASRNLELALRLRKQSPQKQDDDKKDQKKPDKKPEDKPDPRKDQDKKKPDSTKNDQPRPQDPKPGDAMDKSDAQRLMDAAQAREKEDAKRAARSKEGVDGPDW